jgi:hypothetical protein
MEGHFSRQDGKALQSAIVLAIGAGIGLNSSFETAGVLDKR